MTVYYRGDSVDGATHLSLFRPEDDVYAGVGPHRLAQLADLQTKRGILEGFLHLAAAEGPQISTPLGGAAVAVLGGQGLELLLARNYHLAILLELFQCLFLCFGNVFLSP